MTTDTIRKQVLVEVRVRGRRDGKGRGDDRAEHGDDARGAHDRCAVDRRPFSASFAAVAASFNELIVDGCTSTNDTVILLASGRAGPVAEG